MITILTLKKMNLTLLNTDPAKGKLNDGDILSVFKSNKFIDDNIKQGMSPKEIAEVTSTHLINIIRQQFEDTKVALEKT